MNNFWIEHVYLLYVAVLGGILYFGFTFKRALKDFDEWKKELNLRISGIEDKQIGLRENLPKEYVLCSKYDIDVRDIKDMLNKIFDKLDCKADKTK